MTQEIQNFLIIYFLTGFIIGVTICIIDYFKRHKSDNYLMFVLYSTYAFPKILYTLIYMYIEPISFWKITK